MFRTLIVDDNTAFRQSLVEILHARFPLMAIDEAGDGKHAMEKVDGFHPDLVFMDIKLPDDNGLNLTRAIKADHAATAIVVITSYDIPEYREAALQSGANHFIAKGTSSGEEILRLVECIMTDVSNKH